MHRIVAIVTSLEQHRRQLASDPESYRPATCPYCGVGKPWGHGYYQRKADRRQSSVGRELVPVPRFRCDPCQRTCSRLPACLSPRRWYDWVVQQLVLLCLTMGDSLYAAARYCKVGRHTARRWRDWLAARGELFAFFLRRRFPDWGRAGDTAAFWRVSLGERSLAELMAWLDRDLVV
ncbi:MAG: DUF6431 domain-containing protein, partial [Burkholderiaceae bacterium]|nr:DUF6431 domain-containing protein [Burkholderiaceae bacterium]